MRDFIDDLDKRLATLAAEPVAAVDQYDDRLAELAAAAPTASRRRVKRAGLIGSITVALTALFAGITLSTSSLAGLAILDTPTTDASHVPGRGLRGIDLTKAHAFATPDGRGFVMFDQGRSLVCIVIPDRSQLGATQFNQACKSPLSAVEKRGLAVEIAGDLAANPNAVGLSAFVLPEGAKDVQLRQRDRELPITLESGVVVAQLTTNADLRWTVDGTPAHRTFYGPFAAATVRKQDCGDGRIVTLSGPQPTSLADSTLESRAACRR